jgi:predicted nucleotidyltransferase
VALPPIAIGTEPPDKSSPQSVTGRCRSHWRSWMCRSMLKRMRIDPKATISGWPTLTVRKVLRRLRGRLSWSWPDLEAAAELPAGKGRALAQVLRAEGFVDGSRDGVWNLTQAGVTFSSATAAVPVTRPTAERALTQFLDRVRRVDQNPYFLAKVTRLMLFGSMLRAEVQRLSDVDLAVELSPKEADSDRARALNRERAEELAGRGRQFRNILEVEFVGIERRFGS